jgi:hypothetical protein
MQKEQRLSQPSWIFRKARVRSVSSVAFASTTGTPGGRLCPRHLPRQESGFPLGQDLRQSGLHAVAEDEVDLGHPGEYLGLALCEATRNDESGPRISSPEPPDEPFSISVRTVGDRAGVDDENVGAFDVAARPPGLFEQGAERSCVDATDLAAEGEEGVAPAA